MRHVSISRSFRTQIASKASLLALFLLASQAHAKPAYPVLFVHGLSSDASAWSDMSASLQSIGWVFGGFPEYDEGDLSIKGVSAGDYYLINFSDADIPNFPSQHLTLARRGYELGLIIDAVLDANPLSSKVIVVGHSMGGLAARTYIQNMAALFPGSSITYPYKGDVASLITVGTPHLGARIAIVCQDLSICLLIHIDPQSVSLDELRPDSQALSSLNDLATHPLPKDIAYHSIIGIGKTVRDGTGLDGDGIVTFISQNLGNVQGALSLNHIGEQVWVQPTSTCNFSSVQTHTCETSDYGVRAEILSRLSRISAPPSVTTTDAINIGREAATLRLSINPNRGSTSAWFDWGTSASFCCKTSSREVGSGTSTISVSETLGSLTCSTTYYFRARAQNATGGATGTTRQFTTAACSSPPPSGTQLIEDPGFEQGNNAWWVASPNFYINHKPEFPNPHDGNYYAFLSTPTGFSGDNLSGGIISPAIMIPANTQSAEFRFWHSVTTQETTTSSIYDKVDIYFVKPGNQLSYMGTVSNLDNSGTTYREKRITVPVSFYGQNIQIFFQGTTDASRPSTFRIDDVTLHVTTPPGTAPTVSTDEAGSVSSSSAQLNMSVNPNGGSTTVWFNLEAGDSTPDNETERVAIGGGSGNSSVSQTAFNLECGTLYYFRARAENTYGSSVGSVQQFTTSACSPGGRPQADTDPATSISKTSATLQAKVNPNGLSAQSWFAWGETSSLGQETPRQTVGSGTGFSNFSQSISGLSCGRAYYFQNRVSNSAGEDSGAVLIFNTAPCNPGLLPVLTVTAIDSSASESDLSTGAFRIARTGDVSTQLHLSYTLEGTAANSIDYDGLNIPSAIPAGQSFVDVVIHPFHDSEVEQPETVVLTIEPWDVLYLVGNPASATVTIFDSSEDPPLYFYTLPPCRILNSLQGFGPFQPGIPRMVAVHGSCGIPSVARAISANVTVVNPTAAGHLALFPSGSAQPNTSTINFRAGQTRANNAIVGVASSGWVSAVAGLPSGGQVDLILDVNGYFRRHPMIGFWTGTIIGRPSTMTIEQNGAAFTAKVAIEGSSVPVETLSGVSVQGTEFFALRPADGNAELHLSLTLGDCLEGLYIEPGSSRPVLLCKEGM